MSPTRNGRSEQTQNDEQIFAILSEATVRRAQIQLHYPPHDLSSPIQEPIVKVELLVPFSDSWYVIGQCQQNNRLMMFDLDSVISVTPLYRS
jgi:predicted DNA-binding transcriptional regulator YafY